MNNKYHFTLSIHFYSDYDVKNLEHIINIKPYKLTQFSESKGSVKSAKFVYRTDTLSDIYTDDMFAKFVAQIQPKLQNLPSILKEYNGRCVLRIVFDELKQKPCLSIKHQTISVLNDLCVDFEVDF